MDERRKGEAREREREKEHEKEREEKREEKRDIKCDGARHLESAMDCAVVAFDGVLANTLTLRAQAIAESIANDLANDIDESVSVSVAQIVLELPGRTLHECIRHVLSRIASRAGRELDETLVDIMGLQAQRAFSGRILQGIDLMPSALAIIHWAQAHRVRLVLRADSHRRDVEGVLRQWDLESAFTLVRCADDLPRTMNDSTVYTSYVAIAARLDALDVGARRVAWECAPYAQESAGQFCEITDPAVSR